MRRISLALALVGAVAAAGCGGAGGTSPAPSSGGNKGVENASFKVVVRGEGAFFDPATSTTVILPKGGVITSSPAGINCGANGATLNEACEFSFAYGTAVTLTAIPNTAGWVNGWAGACNGTATTCAFTVADTRFVGVRFAASTGSLGAHGPFADPNIHANEYLKFQQGVAGAYDCTACHGGAALTGLGLAPSCASCHGWPLGGHFNPAGAMSGHNSGVCARCHNTFGFRDLIGADGTASNVLSVGYLSTDPSPLDSLSFAAPGQMRCDMCHNAATVLGGGSLSQHKFASGNVVTLTDQKSAICAQCHDGGRPGYNVAQVNAVLAQNSAVLPDAQLATSNAQVRSHYIPAASTLYGATAAAWYQYAGNSYTAENKHGGVNGCTFCHNAHTGELPPDSNTDQPGNTIRNKCGPCHYNDAGAAVASLQELEDARQFGFEGDLDGNGVQEGMKIELDGLAAKLYTAIQTYSNTVAGQKVCYFNNRWYVDTGAAGACGTAPNNGTPNKFTPRLLKATFNYGIYMADPGVWAHNPRYVAETIYDSTADLNVGLGASFVPHGNRAFNGHFGAAEDPSPYAAMIYHGASNALTGEVLPTMGFTSAACYQCHGGQVGYDTYLTGAPAALAAIPAGGKIAAMQCNLCHVYTGQNMQTLRTPPATVYFPPQKGATPPAAQKAVSFTSAQLPPSFPLCVTCHSGRENGGSIDIKIGATTDTSFTITSFTNPHYLGAGGMMMGTSAGMLYQYAGKSYTDKPVFWSLVTNGPHGSPHGAKCVGCHNPKGTRHSFEIDLAATVPAGNYCPGGNMALCAPNTKACNDCHAGAYALAPKITEFEDAAAQLYTAIQAYATANAPVGICYNPNANPYFFQVVGGVCQDGIANAPAAAATYATFNPKLLKAAFNYQWTQKEPGAWAHNEYYVMQVIYDSIVDLGGTPTFTVTASSTDATLNRP